MRHVDALHLKAGLTRVTNLSQVFLFFDLVTTHPVNAESFGSVS